jgi:serine/threonine protein kinase
MSMATPTGGSGSGKFITGERVALGEVAVRPYGKYFLVRKLAEGGMAEIFLAKQVGVEGFERNVVIKRMLQHLSAVPDFVSMFLDEARLATRLEHPNIVQINDLGQADGCYYIAMEYLAGEDFSTIVRTAARRREYVPIIMTAKVIAEAARGLHFAHTFHDSKGKPLNIVHRDISPSNIFVTYTGQVKVLDFGIAKAESRVTNTTAGVVKGKYQYMSPEQAGSHPIDGRSDIFSLGVSLYEALTNTRPFARDTDLAVLNAVLKGDFKPLKLLRPDIHPEMETIVQKAMSIHVADRYQTAEELALALEQFLQAMSSAGGSSGLANFMVQFFGNERVQSKTRIDSLAELAARGVDVPGHKNPLAPGTDPGGVNRTPSSEGPTKATGSPKTTTKVREATRKGMWMGLGLAFAGSLILSGAALGVYRYMAGQDEKAVPVVNPVPIPPTAVDAGVAVIPPSIDPVVETAVDAGVKPAVVVGPPKRLEAETILKVIKQNYGGIARCLSTHEKDLDGEKGQVKLRMTIGASGKVTDASSELADRGVGKCLESHARSIRFPAHKDKEVSFVLPVQYAKK